MKAGKVAVLMVGKSARRAISLKSAGMVLAPLTKRGIDGHPCEAVSVSGDVGPVVLAGKCIEGTELRGGILGNEALPVTKPETPRDFYDYEAKYVANDTRYLSPSGLTQKKERELRALCLAAFQVLGCRGWGRVDLMLDRRGRPYLLEVNTSPGMTDHSLVPMAARAIGLSYEDLCVKILEGAHVGEPAPLQHGGRRVGWR